MKRWLKLALYAIAALVLLGCGLESLYVDTYLESKRDELQAPAGTDNTAVTFIIEQGQSVAEIAGNLKAKGLIADVDLFKRYLQSRNLDSGIQAGSYQLRQTMTIPEIARTLHAGDTTEQQVTIPEGKRLEEIAVIAADQTSVDANQFLQLAQTGWRTSALTQTHEVLAQLPVTATLEGYLFPDTYRLPPEATAYDLIDRMLTNFETQVTAEIRAGFEAQGLNLYEGITLASIVEREAVIATEQPLIAGVYLNRLESGWLLNADPTVQYALGFQPATNSWWKQGLTFDDLAIDSPYNSYLYRGLPPGPICNPGAGTIAAAAAPTETDYFYFMADCTAGDGSHLFSVTEEEHLQNFNRCEGVNGQ